MHCFFVCNFALANSLTKCEDDVIQLVFYCNFVVFSIFWTSSKYWRLISNKRVKNKLDRRYIGKCLLEFKRSISFTLSVTKNNYLKYDLQYSIQRYWVIWQSLCWSNNIITFLFIVSFKLYFIILSGWLGCCKDKPTYPKEE